MLLKIVLEPSWVDLGSSWGPGKGPRHYACRYFVKIHVFEKVRPQEVTWTDLGSILGRFGGAKRLQNGGQEGQKVR